MLPSCPNRRGVIRGSAAMAVASLLPSALEAAERAGSSTRIATNTYPWQTFARRASREFEPHSDTLLRDIASTGINGYEPIINDPAELDGLGERLGQHGLEMRSLYVNSVLHDPKKVEASIAKVLEIAKPAHRLGTRIVVTNPSPIQWGAMFDKTDAQLRLQAKSLGELGRELRKIGMVLAYHNHDAELRQGGREFHHMLTATDPTDVKFCLDAHWVFRGCGDSEVAVFDVLENYHERIVELHLRQSTDGIWNEAFSTAGDIDYLRLFRSLADHAVNPHIVLEQAVESRSTQELTAAEAHRIGMTNLRDAVT